MTKMIMKMKRGGMTMILMMKELMVRGMVMKTTTMMMMMKMKSAFGAALEAEDADIVRAARVAAARAARAAAKAGKWARDTDAARVAKRGKC